MWEVLTQDVSGWAVAGVLMILIALAGLTGQFYHKSIVRQMVEPWKTKALEADKRAERWEAAWNKLYSAQQLRNASESTAVSEMALTLAAAIERGRAAALGEEANDGSVQPPSED